jgi:molybdate transport system substrate-binding protein
MIVVYAASSLRESLDRIAIAWKRRSGQSVKISYGASSALAKQIEDGAPVDLYFPADEAWMDHLEIRRRIDPETRVNLLSNRLVVVAPADRAPASFALTAEGMTTALGGGRLAIAETASVPAGRYAKDSLTTLELWSAVSAQLTVSDMSAPRWPMSHVARRRSASSMPRTPRPSRGCAFWRICRRRATPGSSTRSLA